MWRGSLGVAYLFPPLSSGGASIAPPCPVSTSRSSNRTCEFPASGSPTDVAFRHTLPALPAQLHLKPKLVLESPRLLLEEVIGLRHSPDRCPLHKRIRSQAPFLHRRYPVSRVLRACPPPHTARPVPHGFPVGVYTPPLGLPVLRRISLNTCLRHYPGGTVGCARCRLFPTTAAFPDRQAGRLPHYLFRGLLSVHCSFRLAYSPSRLATLYTGGFGDVVTYVSAPIATDCSNICRVGLSPTGVPRLFTAH